MLSQDGVANQKADVELGFANSAGDVRVPLTEAQTLESDLFLKRELPELNTVPGKTHLLERRFGRSQP